MLSYYIIRKVRVLVATAIISIYIHSHRCQASSLACNTSCTDDQFCDIDRSVCTEQFYNSCLQSTDCHSSQGKCVFLSLNGVLDECSSSSNSGQTGSCFCSPSKSHENRDGNCDAHTAEMSTSFDANTYCVPCSFLIKTNVETNATGCLTLYTFQKPGLGRKGSFFQYCDRHVPNYDACGNDLTCSTFVRNVYLSECRYFFTNLNITNSCFCAPSELTPCTIFSPCRFGYSCARTKEKMKPVCVPSESLMRVEPRLEISFTLPKWTIFILTLTELTFIGIKSIALLKLRKGLLKLALICFAVETIIGFFLTAVQAFILIDSDLERDENGLEREILFGALLFIFTEISAFISETIFLRRKFRHRREQSRNT